MHVDTREPEPLYCPVCRFKVHSRKTLDWPDTHPLQCKRCNQSFPVASWRLHSSSIGAVANDKLKANTFWLWQIGIRSIATAFNLIERILSLPSKVPHQIKMEFFVSLLWAPIIVVFFSFFDNAGFAVLGVVIYFACRLIFRKWNSRVLFPFAISVALLISVTARALIPRVEYWSSEAAEYTDYYHGLTGTHYYRKVQSPFTSSSSGFKSEGPISPFSSNPHGSWETASWDTGFKNIQTQQEWYWYGDKVSESEWHSRNK